MYTRTYFIFLEASDIGNCRSEAARPEPVYCRSLLINSDLKELFYNLMLRP